MENNYANGSDIPIGLGMALAKDLSAMNYFASLDSAGRQSIIEQTHSIQSKEEMQEFVSHFGKGDRFL